MRSFFFPNGSNRWHRCMCGGNANSPDGTEGELGKRAQVWAIPYSSVGAPYCSPQLGHCSQSFTCSGGLGPSSLASSFTAAASASISGFDLHFSWWMAKEEVENFCWHHSHVGQLAGPPVPGALAGRFAGDPGPSFFGPRGEAFLVGDAAFFFGGLFGFCIPNFCISPVRLCALPLSEVIDKGREEIRKNR